MYTGAATELNRSPEENSRKPRKESKNLFAT